MDNWMSYYLFCNFRNGNLNAILFNRLEYLCTRYKEKSQPPISPPFCHKVKAWESGRQDIVIIGISLLTIVYNRKAHLLLFFSHPVFCFSCRWAPYRYSPFQLFIKIQCFQGMTCALVSSVYAHPVRTGGNFCAGLWPSSSIVCFICVSRPFFLNYHVGN